MWRRCGAAIAVLALLCGFSAALDTHAHQAIDSVSDEHHPHGDTLVHRHASAHTHADADHPDPQPAGNDDSTDQIWSVDSFVFQQPVAGHAPSPVHVVRGEPLIQLTSIWLGTQRPQPTAHGPPNKSPSGLRAPPAFLPPYA